MTSSSRIIVAMLTVVVVGTAFWLLLLAPKRQQADELGSQVEQLQVSLQQSQAKAAAGLAAKRDFPQDYRELVTLGKAVPSDDETASLLVELSQIAEKSKVKFEGIKLESGGVATEEAPAAAPAETPAEPSPEASSAAPVSATVPATEAAASLLPLGATIGTAGLGVMPYGLTFSGSFFDIADFIGGLDSFVHAGNSEVAVDGRLVTLNGFALNESEVGFPNLKANFSVTAYLVPPGEGITAGASAAAPEEATASPTATTAR